MNTKKNLQPTTYPPRRARSSGEAGNLQPSRGFTLIEFIIYIAIFSLMTLFLFEFLFGILSNQARGIAREAVINNANKAISAVDFEIRHAMRIYDPTSDFISTSGQLSLVTILSLPARETETYLDIYVNSNQQLCIKRELSGANCITSNDVKVTSLDFQKALLADGTESGVQTIITIEYDTIDTDTKAPFTLQSFSRLRSY